MKTCIITGCNTGIGKITAIELAKQDYEIAMLVRDSEKSRIAFNDIKREGKSDNVKLFYVDLSSLESIKNVVERIKQEYSEIDLLINNAGIYKRKEEKSVDGFEMSIAVNYIATFALTNLLLPMISKAKNPRVINLSSELYKRGKVFLSNRFSADKFNGDKAYADSKLLVVYFTKELAKRLSGSNVTINCVHPGVVGTDVFREYPKWFSKILKLVISKPSEGAKPSIYLATSDKISEISGKYFFKLKQKETDKIANDMELSEEIWSKTEELLKIA